MLTTRGFHSEVSVTPSTSVRVSGNVVGEIHDICSGGRREILSQDAQGRVLVSRERRELVLEQDDRSGMSGVKFGRYVGIKDQILDARLLAPKPGVITILSPTLIHLSARPTDAPATMKQSSD
jgi:hypothetical protein